MNPMQTYRITIRKLLVASLLLTMPCVLSAEPAPDEEIEYLLETIGASNCTFIRNGTRHTSENAEDHLRMKYRKARRYVANGDEFIDKLAAESSWTGKAYTIDCPATGTETSRKWLSDLLGIYRDSK